MGGDRDHHPVLCDGQIMDHRHLELMPVGAAVRLLYHSRHIYLLFGGMTNVRGDAVSVRDGWAGSRVGVLGSILCSFSVILAYAFFREPEWPVNPPWLASSAYLPAMSGCFSTASVRELRVV